MSPDAKRMWNWLVPQLDQMKILAKVDGPLLVRYCETWARWKKAAQFLNQYGDTYIIKDPQGQPRLFLPWPQSGSFVRLSNALSRMEQELGMSPSARTRIQVDVIQRKSRSFKISEFNRHAGPRPPGWRPQGYGDSQVDPDQPSSPAKSADEIDDFYGPRKIPTRIPPGAITAYPEPKPKGRSSRG